MANVKSERNYYPHAVVGMILGMVVACGWMIKIATDNPVEMDTYYMEKYQKVDHTINEILELKKNSIHSLTSTIQRRNLVLVLIALR